MSQISLQELRRVAESLDALKQRRVTDAVMRSDRRQLRIATEDGALLVVSLERDEQGLPRLAVDLIRPADGEARQLEVRFDPA